MADDNHLSERVIKLETSIQKDVEHLDGRVSRLEAHSQNLAADLNEQKVKMQSFSELFGMYGGLSGRIDASETRREQDHKEIIKLLHEKLDKGQPSRWITIALAIISLLTALGLSVGYNMPY